MQYVKMFCQMCEIFFLVMGVVAHFSDRPNKWLEEHKVVAGIVMILAIIGFLTFFIRLVTGKVL